MDTYNNNFIKMITTYLHLHIVIFNKSDTYNYFFIIPKNKK